MAIISRIESIGGGVGCEGRWGAVGGLNTQTQKAVLCHVSICIIIHSQSNTCNMYVRMCISICDRILENGSKAHMKSIVFQHVFSCIYTIAYVFPVYLLHNFDSLKIKFHVMI